MSTLAELDARDEAARRLWWYRRSLATLVIAAVVAGLLLWRDLRDDRPYAKVGVFTATTGVVPAQWRRTVLVPGGRFDVVAAVRDDVTEDPAIHARQAPDGGSFVGVAITPSARPAPTAFGGNADDPPEGPAFTLLADGRRYDLSDNRSGPSTTGWVAVAGSADELVLEASWAGRVQRLDLRTGARVPGSFEALYRQRAVEDTPAATTSCGTPAWTQGWRVGPGPAPTCHYTVDRAAWTSDRGWAKPGRQWLAVTVALTAPSYLIRRTDRGDVPFARYDLFSSPHQYDEDPSSSPDRLDGRAPVTLSVRNNDSERDLYVLVFDVTASATSHTVVLRQPMSVRRRIPTSADFDGAVAQTWTVRVG